MTGQGQAAAGTGQAYNAPPARPYEEHRPFTMNNIRETSQQDRRVYVGNLSYDVKWHHLKDFMRQGALLGDGLIGVMVC
jgi:RNA recognition motif-containing protein